MAIENKVRLYGQVVEKEWYKGKDLQHNMKLILKVARPKSILNIYADNCNISDRKDVRFDYPTVLIRDSKMLLSLMNLYEGDIVLLTGMFCTVPVKKQYKCKCGMVETFTAFSFIHPLSIRICHSREDYSGIPITKQKGEDFLLKEVPYSNRIHLLGHLCDKPNYYNDNMRVCTYQLGIKRYISVKYDDPAIDADYPWIRSLGEQAEKDSQILKKGTLADIYGCIQTRNRYANGFVKTEHCSRCGTHTKVIGEAMEVIPSQIYSYEKADLDTSVPNINSMGNSAVPNGIGPGIPIKNPGSDRTMQN